MGGEVIRGLTGEVSADFNALSRKVAFEAGLGTRLPEAVACLEMGFAAATVFYDFPTTLWLHLRSTNGLERLHGEVKRRTRSIGAFPDRASALRLVTTVALEVSSLGRDRRYLEAVNTDEGTHDVHALILGRAQTGIQASG